MTRSRVRQSLLRDIQDAAKEYHIPQDELSIDVHNTPNAQGDVVRILFKERGSMETYGAEIRINRKKGTTDKIDNRQIHDTLKGLEEAWLESNGRSVTFYKGHGFFYQYKSDMGKASLSVQCTVCQHMELVTRPSDILDEYRDVFLIKLLPEAHAKCDCPAGEYDSVKRPRLHGL